MARTECDEQLPNAARETCRSIDCYAEGEECKVEVNGMVITMRLVGRKGRRARIQITAPPCSFIRKLKNTAPVIPSLTFMPKR